MNRPAKAVFVTGAARGLGKAIAERFIRDGARVAAFDNHGENLTASVAAWNAGDRVLSFVGDVRERDTIKRAVDATVQRWGRIDILANVAGVAREDEFLKMEPGTWQEIIDINLTGMFNVGQIVSRQMVRQGGEGVIINMASKNGVSAEIKYAHYNASKAGIILLTKSMAVELAEYSIRVNAVAPGYILSPLCREIDSPEWMEFYKQRFIPLNRLGDPEEVAGVFAFLASDDARFITGQTLVVDGGQLCNHGPKPGAFRPNRNTG